MAERRGYSGLQIGLHLLIVIFITDNYLQPNGIGRALNALRKGEAMASDSPLIHAYVGGAVFTLVLIRLVIRLRRGVQGPAGQGLIYRAGEVGHWVLYALMIAVPTLGAITWYGMVAATGDFHGILANAPVFVALIHALAAIFHQYVIKDRLLRMMKPG